MLAITYPSLKFDITITENEYFNDLFCTREKVTNFTLDEHILRLIRSFFKLVQF